ncbi:hypothetical protein ACTOWA_16115 [Herbaspirillum seropedicae]|uniref:hypothetical protein n=1 Tax=Herbaspirillum seropedicae TaxID=964 RepID=UPI003F8D08E6
MKSTPNEFLVLKALNLSVGQKLHFYTLYRKTLLSPAGLTRALNALELRKYISVTEEIVTLTPQGLDFSLQSFSQFNRKNHDISHTSYKFPDEFKAPQLPIDHAYVPKWDELPLSLKKNVLKKRQSG